MILAGDIGGTNTRLALFDDSGEPHNIQQFPSQKYDTLEQIIAEYVKGSGDALKRPVARAGFGVAGPVANVDGRLMVRTTNLKWTIDQRELAEELKVPVGSVAILNDLAANATGIDALSPDKFLTLQVGQESPGGTRAIISAGTGLGEAGLLWDGEHYRPIPSEGGHAGFAPTCPIEDELLLFLRDRQRETFNGHVSCERVLSGPGLANLFEFFRSRDPKQQKVDLPLNAPPGEVARYVSKAGLDGSCPLCTEALKLFISLYGAAAGNLALQFLALGGLYVGGGIAPKIASKLNHSDFMRAFLEKGPLKSRVLEKVPVRVILDEYTALRGAARFARLML